MIRVLIELLIDVFARFLLFLMRHLKVVQSTVRKQLKDLGSALGEERKETSAMLKSYASYVNGRGSAQDLKDANKQFRELLKTLGLGVLLVLPFSFLTLPNAKKI